MAAKLLVLHLITALIAVNLILAEEESERFFNLPFFGGNSSNGFLGLPFFGSGGNGSSGLPNLPSFSNIPGLPSLPNLPFFGGGQLPSFFGSRQERSAEEGEEQDRLFFGSIVSCNYTSQGGTSCSSCRQAFACYPNNVGRVRTCRGLTRYCNNGRCSFIPGSQCSNSTST